MKKQMILLASASLLFAAGGCRTTTQNIDRVNDTAGAIAGFDYRDINRSIAEAVADMLASGRMQRSDGGRWIVNVMPVKDDTSSLARDTGALSEAIHASLRRS